MPALAALLVLFLRLCAHASSKEDEAASSRVNVLFVIVEDLRPELSLYSKHPFAGENGHGNGSSGIVTPNIDRLAAKSLAFDLAIAQVSVCAPSRASLLTGLRPDTLGIYDFSHFGAMKHFRTLLSHYHRKGYMTSGSGKVFHYETSRHYSQHHYGDGDWERLERVERRFQNSSVTPDALHDDGFFRDARIIDKGIEFLNSMHSQSLRSRARGDSSAAPWLLAVGLKGTHMPYHMPKKYYDLYSDKALLGGEQLSFPSKTPLLHYSTKPEGSHIDFMNGNGSLRWKERENYLQNVNNDRRRAGADKRVSERGHAELYRGYLACLAYTDAQLGRLLDQLDALALWDSTVIVFTSDHGMHLGEKGMWTKWTLFDEAARVPLLIHSPLTEHRGSLGQHYVHPVELLDIFPTLVDLTSTPLEVGCPPVSGVVAGEGPVASSNRRVLRHTHCDALDGVSLRQAFSSINSFDRKGNRYSVDSASTSSSSRQTQQRGSSFALTQKMTCKLPGIKDTDPHTPGWIDFCPFRTLPRDPALGAMGYSLRFIDFRYTAWLHFDTDTFLPFLSEPPLAEELYSHEGTFADTGKRYFHSGSRSLGSAETINLCYDSSYSDLLRSVRLALYDFLFFDASHAHLYQRRVSGVESMRPVHLHRHHSRRPHSANASRHYYTLSSMRGGSTNRVDKFQ